MKFSSKKNGRRCDAYPIDSNGNVSPISKGPSPRGSKPLRVNTTQFKVPVPKDAKPKHEHIVEPPAQAKPKVSSSSLPPQTSSGNVQETRDE